MQRTIGFLGIPSLYLTWWNIPVIGGLAYLVVRSFYRLFLHPLRHFPGPRLRALSSLPHASSNLRGMLHHDLATLHRQYGEVVRIAPDHLSFISAEAWKDIYGHAAARKFLKVGYGEALPGVHSIVTAADPEIHTRQRRLISHAFSDTALREQEEVVINYVNLLVKTLKEKAAKPADAVVNLVRWFDFTTFDLIGDLSFGESFGCLDVDAYHPWVETLLQVVVAVTFIHVASFYSPLDKILMAMAPKKAMEIRDNHTAMSMEKVHRRLKLHTNRADFWKYILRHQDDAEKSMSLKEMEVNASTLIIAGSETISTTCSGVIFFLSHQPLLMKELCDELRTTFKRDDEINMTTIGGLKILHATLMEGMRLFPPAPAGAPRLSPPGGAYVAGSFVAGGTTVMISQLAAYTYPPHFKNPLKFDPSRWLGNPEYDSDNKDVYQPFSMGPRNCVGKNLAWIETKIILAKMLWNFDFELLDDNFEPQRQKMYILWQKPELRVRLKVRPGI